MKKGIIFDLDGTLWDSAAEVVKAWNEVIETLEDKDHLVTVLEMYSLMGKPMNEIGDLVFPNVDRKRRDELMDQCCIRENEYLEKVGGQLVADLEETLKVLSEEYELFIVSNCQIGYIEAFLSYYQFGHYFIDTENYGNTGHLKGYNIDLVKKRNQLDFAVYVGDTLGDYDAAKEAGIPFIFAEYGFGEVPRANYRLDCMKNLPQIVMQVYQDVSK